MKKIIPFVSLLCVLGLGIVSCGKNSNSNPVDNATQATRDPSLQSKIFRGQCSLKPLDTIATGIGTAGGAAIKSAREQYQFIGANVTHVTSLYKSTDCSGPESLIFKETGDVNINNNERTADDGKSIDINYNHLTMQVKDDSGITIAHDLKLCGTDDWTASTGERDVTGHAADLTCYRRALPSKDINIYRVDGGDLYFGNKGLLERNGQRPTNLNMTDKYSA